LGQAAWIR
jgi:hypothetical protein